MLLAEVWIDPGVLELDSRRGALAVEPSIEATLALVGRAGRHGVRDVVLVGPGHGCAGLHFELAGPKLKHAHADLGLRRGRGGEACDAQHDRTGNDQDVCVIHRHPSFHPLYGRDRNLDDG